jgi:hypothetical protein
MEQKNGKLDSWIEKVVSSTRSLIKTTSVITRKESDLAFHLTTDPELQAKLSSSLSSSLDMAKGLLSMAGHVCDGRSVSEELLLAFDADLIENDYDRIVENFDRWLEILVILTKSSQAMPSL